MTENNLQELTNKIRKAIPRLMEATKGCLIQSKYYGIAPMEYYDSEYYEYLFIDELLHFRKCNQKDITIIGHEPLLSDVLEWFIIKTEPSFDSDEQALNIVAQWDLSKPCLKDQSKELIKHLNKL